MNDTKHKILSHTSEIMEFVVLLFLTSIGCVLSSGKHQYPAFDNVFDTHLESDEVSENIGHLIFKKSISTLPNYENTVSPEGTAQEPCRLSIPTEELSAVPQNTYSEDEDQDLPMEVMPPRVPSFPYNMPFNEWTPYSLDYIFQDDGSSYNGSPYYSYNMPYMYPNAVPPVRSLPPVISTHIHETIPKIPDIERGFDMNDLSDDDVYFPPYVRAVRSRDEDFFEQLQKDAIIPNILPTMPFPYMRAASQLTYPPQAEYIPIARFPPGSGANCALPYLVSCSPDVYQGSPTQNVYSENPLQSAPAAYRKNGAVPTLV